MPADALHEFYVSGLHALRSASEQGRDGARGLADKASSREVAAVLVAMGELAGRHEEAVAGLLRDLGVEPNGFKDQIMEGVGRGTAEMIEAASDKESLDLALLSGAQSGIDYHVHAFGGQGGTTERLDLPRHADTFARMGEEWTSLAEGFGAVSEATLDALEEAPEPALQDA